MEYTHRYLARVVLEAQTALFLGSGKQGLLKDALVQKDHHGLPMIQGTSLLGVLRHSFEDQAFNNKKEHWNNIFGFQDEKKGIGSQLRISSAYLLLPNNEIAEGLSTPPSKILDLFETLPLRQHVRINHKGVAKDQGLFDNEVVFKGCKFKFEIELRGNGSETKQWHQLLRRLRHPLFRIGQGTRNGYGKLGVDSCQHRIFNLRDNPADFKDYLDFDPSLNSLLKDFTAFEEEDSEHLIHYQLKLQADDSFFIFGSGYANEEVDQTAVFEDVLQYHNNELIPVKHSLIPASSIKGALSHRTCFHYNRINEKFSDQLLPDEYDEHIGTNNEAVRQLFGFEADDKKTKTGQRGRVISNDLYYTDLSSKIFNHVAIDRFTGGAIDGALFSEAVLYKDEIILDIWLEDYPYDKQVIDAFESALEDLRKGYLPLGGMTTKGHGLFKGELIINKPKKIEHV